VHALPHADTDSTIRFVRDVDRAWDKVMNLDRFDQPYHR
jgi:catalase (peroxidase I)